MPEELTEEQTRAAFADMRAADLTFIRPPGSAAAQRTVRRRRRAGVIAVAAGVGIAIVSTATVMSVVDTDRAAPAPAAPSPSFSRPPLTEAQLKQLASEAMATLGADTNNADRKKAGKPAIVSSNHGPARPNMGTSGSATSTNKTGDYVVEIICLGEGTIRTTVWAASHDPQSMRTPTPDASVVSVRCGDKPAPVRVDVHAPKPKLVHVQHQADPAAVGHAVFAHIVRLP